ncbi:MAG: hypothetical protein PHV06_06815 [bacterium]|nr:hypothetical protein [bacterium]
MADFPEKMNCLKVSLSIICTGCNGLIPVNGPVQKVKCIKCGTIKNLKGEHYGWHNLLYNIFKSSLEHHKNTGPSHSIKLSYVNEWPKCSKCKHQLGAKHLNLNDIKNNQFICPKCHTAKSISEPLKSIKKPYKSVLYIIDGIFETRNPGVKPIKVNKIENTPVTFNCSSCGAGLEINGDERIIKCEFCGSRNFISDDLWVNVHSTPKVRPWYIVFDPDKVNY